MAEGSMESMAKGAMEEEDVVGVVAVEAVAEGAVAEGAMVEGAEAEGAVEEGALVDIDWTADAVMEEAPTSQFSN